MKPAIKIYIRIMIVLFALSSASCAPKNFSSNEKEIINNSGGNTMRLWTTADKTDSLFLRQPSLELSAGHIESPEFAVLKAGMLNTVNDPANRGVGIAAPQVGIPYRLIAVQRFDKEGEPFEFYINPRITWYSEVEKRGYEGCLSIPDISGTVKRPGEIDISYWDETTGKTVAERVTGYTAVIFQHETDHLDGILFTDRLERPEPAE